jgi:GDPmannose 4,6-dehydratase
MTVKAIIFGITGQDGSYLAELLHGKGYEVIGVTRRVSVDTLQRISHILPQIKIVEGDITDAFSVSNVIKEHEPDEVYNLAAQSHVGTSFTQPSLTWDVTAGGCLNVLEGIRYSGRKEKIKFYQAGSSEMFGKNFSTRDRRPSVGDIMCGLESGDIKYQDEDTPFSPQSPYAIAKLASHHLVRSYRDSYGIFACSGILFNHESERRGEKFVTRKITKWIGEFVRWSDPAFETGQIQTVLDQDDENRLYNSLADGDGFPKLRLGNLEAFRDWGHAEDYVRAMWLMMQQEVPDDYVVATGKTHSVRDFLNVAFAYVGITEWDNFVIIDPEFYRPAEVDYLLGFPNKAKSNLGWNPDISFKDLVHRMMEKDIDEAKLQRPYVQEIQAGCAKA